MIEIYDEEIPIWKYHKWYLRLGKPAEAWITQMDIVGELINTQKLTPLGAEHYPTGGLSPQTAAIEAQCAPGTPADQKTLEKRIPDFRGGLKCPHLHYKRDIYLLNSDQWKIFSDKVINRLKDKLSKTKTVSFEQLIEASEGISGLV